MAIGGVILTIAVYGSLRIDWGYVRAEDEPKPEPVMPSLDDETQQGTDSENETTEQESGSTVTPFRPAPEPENKAPALAAAYPGIADSPARQTLCEAEDTWRTRLPREHGALWGWLQDQDVPTLLSLMAVCVARTMNAGPRTWTTPEGSQCIAAQVATAAGLDMRTCWTATKDSYLGRVPKALIVEAVREGAGTRAAGQIGGSNDHHVSQGTGTSRCRST